MGLQDPGLGRPLGEGAQPVPLVGVGGHGPEHLIFAAGYPSIGMEEYEAIRRVAAEVDSCSLATHGRMLRSDVDLGIRAMRAAAHGRVSFAVPISENYSRIMLHQPAEETARQAVEMARYALDASGGIPIDVAFGGASGIYGRRRPRAF